jgi:hypothetical protein
MKNSTKIRYSIAIVLLQAQTLFAQTPGFDDDVQDVPVDNWILPMAIIGLCIVFFRINIKSQTEVK